MNTIHFIVSFLLFFLPVIQGQQIQWTSIVVDQLPPVPYTTLARQGHVAVPSPDGYGYFMFGGEMADPIDSSIYDSRLWYFDFNSSSWSIVDTPGPSPAHRSHAVLLPTFDGTKALLYGGEDETTVYDDVWLLDLINNRWIEVWDVHHPPVLDSNGNLTRNPSTSNPSLKKHAGCYDSHTNLFYFQGGMDHLGEDHGELYAFQLFQDGAEWYHNITLLSSSGPVLRSHTAVCVSTDSVSAIVIFGGLEEMPGASTSVQTNLLYKVNLISDGSVSWTAPLSTTDVPASRFGHVSLYNSVTREMWVIGGSTTPFGFDKMTIPDLSDHTTWSWRSVGTGLRHAAFYHSVVAVNEPGTNNSILIKFGGRVNSNFISASEYVQYLWNNTAVDFNPARFTSTLAVTKTNTMPAPTNNGSYVTATEFYPGNIPTQTVEPTQTPPPSEDDSKLFGVLDRQMQIIVFGGGIGFITLCVIGVLICRYTCKRVKKPETVQTPNFYDL